MKSETLKTVEKKYAKRSVLLVKVPFERGIICKCNNGHSCCLRSNSQVTHHTLHESQNTLPVLTAIRLEIQNKQKTSEFSLLRLNKIYESEKKN